MLMLFVNFVWVSSAGTIQFLFSCRLLKSSCCCTDVESQLCMNTFGNRFPHHHYLSVTGLNTQLWNPHILSLEMLMTMARESGMGRDKWDRKNPCDLMPHIHNLLRICSRERGKIPMWTGGCDHPEPLFSFLYCSWHSRCKPSVFKLIFEMAKMPSRKTLLLCLAIRKKIYMASKKFKSKSSSWKNPAFHLKVRSLSKTEKGFA